MKFTPNRKDAKFRFLYGILFLTAVACLSIKTTGAVNSIILSVALVCIVLSVAFFIRYECTTYTYILMERNERLDFYVDKRTGRRGSYVCYYPLSDAIALVKLDRNTKGELREKYKKIFFFNYAKNVFCCAKYIIVFEYEGKYDAVIFEPDEKFVSLITADMAKNNDNDNEIEI